jgi:eukaryotic-like serine/threonine-protein kinase
MRNAQNHSAPASTAGIDTRPSIGVHAQASTAPFESGGATIDGPSNGDRGKSLSYDLDSQLEDPMTTLPPGVEERQPGGPRIAGFELLDVLGVGGMGIVYKARQLRLDRFVALKMIRSGAGASPDDLARFDAEARAVAAIDHPNIVQIFEIGEHDGLPYFSLEFLAGGTLAKKIGGKPQPAGEAARIVEVLARAMSVAHQHKAIHRDLKPTNVLFAADGTLKITDFGLVKRLESDSGQTRSGSILGTPSYMAPEQAWGDTQRVGPASDQYALGAILYELLTGRPPFQGTSVLDTLDMVRTREPVAPSQLQPKTPRDAETICLKCLEKDASRRYSDVFALAEDLRRFQAGETILARPVSGAERLWRWCLRNQKVAGLGVTVALLLVVVAAGAVASTIIFGHKNQALYEANLKAENRRNDAETKRKLAETAARAANVQNRSAVDAWAELIVQLEGNLRHVAALEGVREQMLEKASKNLEAAARAMTDLRHDIGWGPTDEERNWRSLATARQRLGQLRQSQGRLKDAMEQFRQMDAIVQTLAAAAPGDLAAQTRLARSQRLLGIVAFQDLGDTEGAKQYFTRALEINRACLAQLPNDDKKYDLANTLGQLAGVELRLGHLEQARELYREEVAVRESLSPARANHLQVRLELSGYYEKLAELSLRMGEIAQGRQLYDRCKALREQVAAEQPDFWPAVSGVARSFNNEGFLRFPHGRDPMAARVYHQQALDLIQKRAEADPTNVDTQAMLAETIYYEATCALHSGDATAAADGFARCLAIRKTLAKDSNVKMPQVSLMVALARCGEHAEAARIAKALVATPPRDEHLYFQAACGYALAAGAVGNDEVLTKHYTAAAVDCLRMGWERGWTDLVSLETDPDLAPIRDDPAFQKLLGPLRQPREKTP